MIYEATLKPIAVDPARGEIHRIRVQANNKDEAAQQVRYHAEFERCGNYAITKIEEIKK